MEAESVASESPMPEEPPDMNTCRDLIGTVVDFGRRRRRRRIKGVSGINGSM